MSFSTLLLAVAMQSPPALASEIGSVAFNWSYTDQTETVFGIDDAAWLPERESYVSERRLQRLARPQSVSRADALDVNQLGLNLEFYPGAGSSTVDPGWRFVVGFENERLEISPGATGAALLYRGGSVSVADGYAGMATPIGDRALVTFGYVRQERTAFAAAREWSDDSHFLGMTYQLSW